jgi:hypothetical protein
MRKSKGFLVVTVLAIGFVLGLASAALTAERHPEIHLAQSRLAQAKNALEHAAHDFAGHRVKAIEHITEAQEELKLALESDKN